MKLYAIRSSSLLAKLGFANGDTVLGVNKHVLNSAVDWLEIYAKLRDAKRLEVQLLRRGNPLTLTFAIVP
jgi:S1-C subfamily serine protease